METSIAEITDLNQLEGLVKKLQAEWMELPGKIAEARQGADSDLLLSLRIREETLPFQLAEARIKHSSGLLRIAQDREKELLAQAEDMVPQVEAARSEMIRTKQTWAELAVKREHQWEMIEAVRELIDHYRSEIQDIESAQEQF